MSSGQTVIGVQIPENQALTGEIDLGEYRLAAIEMPEAFNGATLTFQSKANRYHDPNSGADEALEDWDDVYDDTGTEVSVTVGSNRVVVIGTATKAAIGALRYLRIRSGTAAAPVNQNPTRELKIIAKL